MILETTFLVDLEREAWRQEKGRAFAFLEADPEARLCIALTTAAELACGPRVHERSAWERLFGRFEVLIPDRDVAWQYGRTFRYLREQGLLIGTNDLWIAATSLAHQMPLVTRNDTEFRRVPELDVRSY
jgi:tRNA(fMet)-specific endonuclease VapC